MKVAYALLSMSLLACGNTKNPKNPSREFSKEIYDTSDRLFDLGFVQGTFITSMGEDGARDELGEGLIYGALGMSFLPCDKGAILEKALAERLAGQQGVIGRIEPIGEYANGREMNFDTETGLLSGIIIRAARCGVSETLKQAWMERWKSYEAGKGCHPNVGECLPKTFQLLRNVANGAVTGQGQINRTERQRLISEATLYAASQIPVKGPGYRVHLSWLYLLSLDYAGYAVDRGNFCGAIRGSGIEIIEHWCGRGNLEAWINGYEYDKQGYAWQRAKWESNNPRSKEPAIDFLMALTLISRANVLPTD